jgi:hypothetical protein
MYATQTRRRRSHLLGNRVVRLVVVSAAAALIWNSGFLTVEKRLVSAARWTADHSGATRASEIWRSRGRPAVDHAVTTGYQTLRQSATHVLDYLDISGSTNRTVEKLGKSVEKEKAVEPVEPKSQRDPRKEDDNPTERN